MEILVGADPEVFVSKAGQPFSAHGLVSGTKKQPLKVDQGAVQVDGTALEFNIDPAKNVEEFVFRITRVQSQLEEMMKKADPELNFNISPSVIYPKDIFDNIPEEAKELGCEPDFNAYTGSMNPRPDSALLKGLETMRTGAGHVHIGWTSGADPMAPDHFTDCRMITKVLDYSLGLAARGWDKDTRRSKLYGAPGAFRPKPYGMEYRSLSNAWLQSEELIRFVYTTAHRVVAFMAYTGGDRMTWINHPQNELESGRAMAYFNYYWSEIGLEHPMMSVQESVKKCLLSSPRDFPFAIATSLGKGHAQKFLDQYNK